MFAPLSKPPLHNKKDFVLPKITNNNKPQHYIRSNSNASSHNLKNEDSFSHMISNDDSNNVSYISTNSNSSIGLNKKPITFKNVKNFKEKKITNIRTNSANSSLSIGIHLKLPKEISSKSWAIYNVNTGHIIYGKKHHQPREIASLTKIMTCYVSIMVSQRLRINLSDIIVKITRMAASMNGTSAKLREGDHLKMIDLLYGLMLPSGNDAAFALAEALGCLLFYEINDTIKLDEVLITKNINVSNEFPDSNEPLRYFLHEMNKTAKELKLYNTTYANPHGLMNRFNKSTASDVAKLSCVTLQNSLFLQIVNTKFYECSIKNYRIASIRKESWFNTNKLLDSGFYGVKTGITDAAGPCLVTSLKIIKKNHKDVWVVCVILNCRTMDKRWGECEELLNWGIKEILWKNEDVGINLKKNN